MLLNLVIRSHHIVLSRIFRFEQKLQGKTLDDEPVGCRDFGLTVRAAVEHPCDSFGGFVGLKIVEGHVLVHDVPALEESQILCKDGAVGIEFLVWKGVRYVADGAFS